VNAVFADTSYWIALTNPGDRHARAGRPDKGYSLVDCISMQTMRREGITDALTHDRHFEQEGFRALLARRA